MTWHNLAAADLIRVRGKPDAAKLRRKMRREAKRATRQMVVRLEAERRPVPTYHNA